MCGHATTPSEGAESGTAGARSKIQIVDDNGVDVTPKSMLYLKASTAPGDGVQGTPGNSTPASEVRARNTLLHVSSFLFLLPDGRCKVPSWLTIPFCVCVCLFHRFLRRTRWRGCRCQRVSVDLIKRKKDPPGKSGT